MTADTYSSTLGSLVMQTGNDNNTWGGNANTAVFQIFEDAIANVLTEAVTGGTLDLSGTPPPAAASQVRYAAVVVSGVLGSNQIITVPNLTKFWWVKNATSGAFTLTIKTPSGSASTAIPQNSGWQLVQCDAANVITVSPFNSKQIQMPDGTVGAPAFSNLTEPKSGWWRAGTQDWRLSINGVDVLQCTGTGASTPSIVNVLSPNALQIAGVQPVPAGTVVHYDGITAPAGWVFLYGQTVSRPIANGGANDTYKQVWNAITTTVVGSTNSNTAITGLASDMRGVGLDGSLVEGTGISTGTTITFTGATTATLSAAASSSSPNITLRILPFGQGDASTTFTLRDGRGVSLFGRDDMNGTAAGKITVAGNNTDGKALKSGGGLQNHTLTQAQLPNVNFVISGITATAGGTNIDSGLGSNSFLGRVNTADYQAPVTITAFGTAASGGSGSSYTAMPPYGISNLIMRL